MLGGILNDLERMIAMINRKNVFSKFTETGEVFHACAQFHMPNIHTILKIHGTQGISAGYSLWYFDYDGNYLGCGFDA
jgi:hypothetical protein